MYWTIIKNSKIFYKFSKATSLLSLAIILWPGLQNPAQAESYHYDNAGRLTNVIFDDGTSISYSYDNNSNITDIIESDVPLANYINGILNIPVVSVGNTFYRVKLTLQDPKAFEFKLSFYEVLNTPTTTGMSVFSNNILSIPEIVVDQTRATAELRLTDASTFTFILTDLNVL